MPGLNPVIHQPSLRFRIIILKTHKRPDLLLKLLTKHTTHEHSSEKTGSHTTAFIKSDALSCRFLRKKKLFFAAPDQNHTRKHLAFEKITFAQPALLEAKRFERFELSGFSGRPESEKDPDQR